ncbi:MAG TPA: hypothetical protein VGI55_18235 [Solirubrobacteraceae bacterium]
MRQFAGGLGIEADSGGSPEKLSGPSFVHGSFIAAARDRPAVRLLVEVWDGSGWETSRWLNPTSPRAGRELIAGCEGVPVGAAIATAH